jgi:hypothetical protein
MKKSFLFVFIFIFICFWFQGLYSLISGLGAAGVVVVETKVFFHIVPG